VLLKLADKTNIYVRFPASLKKKITVMKRGISVRDALKRLLRDFNYAIIYSGPDKNQTSISRVIKQESWSLKKESKDRKGSTIELKACDFNKKFCGLFIKSGIIAPF